MVELENVSRWAKNERLYKKLIADGLSVYPIESNVWEGGIDYMVVSTELIDARLAKGTFASVGLPMEGLKVGNIVAAP